MRRALVAIAVMLLTGIGAVAASAAPASAAGLQFLSAGVVQNGTSAGAFGTFTVKKPFVVPGDAFSMATMQVFAATVGSVEVGWIVDRALNGDDEPHLFVRYRNSVEQCPNACGFRQVDPNLRPGAALTVNSTHQFMIEQFQGNWWVGDGPVWIGYFPNALWGNAFTQAASVQWMGEVLATEFLPCTEMGSGETPPSPDAASVTGIGYFSGPPVHISAFEQNRAFYSAAVISSNSMQFGGRGECNNPI
jgi:hypothetical protein